VWLSLAAPGTKCPENSPERRCETRSGLRDINIFEIDPTQDFEINCDTQLVTVKDGINLPAITAFRFLAAKLNASVVTIDSAQGLNSFRIHPARTEIALLRASVVIGSLLADGIGDAILIRGESGAGMSLRLAYNILQAAGCRSLRRLRGMPVLRAHAVQFANRDGAHQDAHGASQRREIAIMGCIVNGPGEMADADFGYVGGAPGKINLYVGKHP